MIPSVYLTFASSFINQKEVWKILPSYEELRRGAIGRGKEVEVMSIRCHVTAKGCEVSGGEDSTGVN